MSFDIFFQPCRFGDKLIERVNPFTGEVQSVPRDVPLNADEVGAVQKVLREVTVRGPDEHGCCVVELSDGGGAEVFADDLETGCMVSLRGMTPGLLTFLYDLLKAGNWVMIPAMEDTAAITTSLNSLQRVPDDFLRIVVCNSVEELSQLLSGGIRAWEKYRDQVMGEQP
jgi:hypothetical protein